MKRLFIYVSVFLIFSENIMGQAEQQSLPKVEEMRRKKTDFNLEEIKVRWKKAALENCTGLPCNNPAAPGSPTGVKAVDGNGQATVSFTVPASDGGRPITSYTVTSNPGGITGTGSGSPIIVSGLTNGTNYTFTVVATNVIGNSSPSSASSAVTPFLCVSNTVKDFDGNTYNTVLIGTQCWTKENLRVRRYSDGMEIRFDKSGSSTGGVSQTWSGTGLNYGAYTLYAHDSVATPSSNLLNYGYLYNWYAVKGIITDGGISTKNICPIGWHVPTDSDWNKLIISIDSGADTTGTAGQSATAGGKMKSTSSLWNSPNTGADNTSGFSALPSGFRYNDGIFYEVRDNAFFWSAAERDILNAWSRTVNRYVSNVGRGDNDKSLGGAIRCLKD